jgi:hypothetical protein
MTEFRLSGRLALRDRDDSADLLFCGPEVVAEWAEQFEDKQVTVRYWTAAHEMSDEDIKRTAIEELLGLATVNYGARYSEITGYLWTDENFKVGGHDMIERLKSDIGKYLLLEVTCV